MPTPAIAATLLEVTPVKFKEESEDYGARVTSANIEPRDKNQKGRKVSATQTKKEAGGFLPNIKPCQSKKWSNPNHRKATKWLMRFIFKPESPLTNPSQINWPCRRNPKLRLAKCQLADNW